LGGSRCRSDHRRTPGREGGIVIRSDNFNVLVLGLLLGVLIGFAAAWFIR
jgi:hypothetical protein